MSFPSEPTSYQQVGPQTFRAPKRRSKAPLVIAWSAFGALAVAVGASVFVAVNRSDEPKSAAAPPPVASTAPATPAPAPSPPAAAVPKAGQTVTFTTGAKATVYRWQQPVAKKETKPSEFDYPPDYVWGALDIQVCIAPDAAPDTTISAWTWTIGYADNSTVEPADITGLTGWPKPQYPLIDRKIPAGSCTRGWITFAVPAGVKPTTATYAPSSVPATRWALS